MNRVCYPSGYIPIRLACAGEISEGLLLKTILKGADGILVLGCPGDCCHHRTGSTIVEKTVTAARNLIGALGMSRSRISVDFVKAAEFDRLHHTLKDFHAEILSLGPSPLRNALKSTKGESLERSAR